MEIFLLPLILLSATNTYHLSYIAPLPGLRRAPTVRTSHAAAAVVHVRHGPGRATKAWPPRSSSSCSHATPTASEALQYSAALACGTMVSSRACATKAGGACDGAKRSPS